MKKKLLLFVYFCIISLYGHAELSITLNVETPGSLSTMIASSKKSMITHLTLSGKINGSDIAYIREMAGAGFNSTLSSSKCSLIFLDIANCIIVEGGSDYACQHTKYRGQDYYEDSHKYKTKKNTITAYMFDNCYRLKTLILPKTVTKIEAEAFFDTSICSITLPDNLEEIECAIPSWYITELKISENNQYFRIVDGVLYSYDMKTLYRCPVNYTNPIFQIPEGVEIVFNSAFNYCRNIKEIKTSSTLKKIRNKALGWMSLDKFVLDPNIDYSSIGDFTNIQEVIIPKNYKEFNPSLFGSTSYDYAEWDGTKVYNVKVYSETPPALISQFNRATLAGNLFVPKGSYSTYYFAYRWGDFSHIYEMNNDGNEKKCAKPTISYSNGKLTFNCETNGVTYKSTITDTDITSYNSSEVQLCATYIINVYAIKQGFNNSDVASATLCWIDVDPKTEGVSNNITQVRANAVLIQADNGQISIAGADDGTIVNIYGVNGQQYGSTISHNGYANINANLQSGSIAIIKIGDKSIKVTVK